MSSLAHTIMQEIEGIPEERLTSVLMYVRFIRLGLDQDDKQIEHRFAQALRSLRATVEEMNITEEDVAAEIRAVRAKNHAHCA
jgi:hypothetical protein